MTKLRLPIQVRFLLVHYFSALLFFTLFRLLFFFIAIKGAGVHTEDMGITLHAFLIGLQFDTVIMGYVLALPTLVLIAASFFRPKQRVYKYINLYIFLLLFWGLLICAIDIPYFQYNSARLSAIIFNWSSNSGIIFKMIAEEPSYLVFALVFVLIYASYVFIAKKSLKKFLGTLNTPPMEIPSRKTTIGWSLVCAVLVFMAMRGRIDNPIKINHSFFCNNSFYNQLGLNPVFTLLKSMNENNKLNVIDEKVAMENVKGYLGIQPGQSFTSPIARTSISDKEPLKKNIVLVIMESMSADKTGHFGNPNHLTPFLDSLCNVCYCFNNIYTAGRHTYNGIFSTLYSFPAILREHSMSTLGATRKFSGFPGILKTQGYQTVFFTTHSELFDNMGTFLPANHFDQLVSQVNYDQSKVQSSFGVPDHVMFDYALAKFDTMSKKGTPFFGGMMTVSDHGPYIIPSGIPFKPKQSDIHEQIVEYCDWALNHFLTEASKKDWFKNTIFIFVADHGAIVGQSVYDIPLSFHHSPLLIYSADTSLIKPKQFENFGCQIDIFPTVMKMLNISYVNNTMGVDLINEKRPYAFFSSDDKIGCINEDLLYTYSINGNETLNKYKSGDPKNYLSEDKTAGQKMKEYALSMTEAAKWLMENGKTDVEVLKK